MTEPCKQTGPISALQERTSSHEAILQGIKLTLEENNKLLGQIAVVMSDINHLHEGIKRNEHDINGMFERIRTLELLPGRGASKAWWVVLSAVAGAAGSMITGLVLLSVRWVLAP